jgi:acetyl/propionyl-CoA carboxylase alpha subunit
MQPRPLRKLLVANRGEIALRVIRIARLLGIKTVAVFSEADKDAAHVAAADDARLIGPAAPSESYLNIAKIIAAANETGSDAIHPGYGFLSERAEFARAVEKAGMIFVGPTAAAMEAVGDKVAARRLATSADVPVVPGIETAERNSVRAFAVKVGYPILVKASAGGGGRGMRVVEDEAALDDALESASREAKAAFGDGRIFVEKYLARPRHIEVQILGDRHGKIVALGERECSIQRRHQKLIEESPSVAVDENLRAKICAAAIRIAGAVGYQSAGTVEFMLENGNFYLLEVNARLQVEHPVTELRFGCDLVAEQLRIAAGEHLRDPKSPRGWSIECRLTAEDAEHEFRPSTGRVAYLNLPMSPGVRVDTFLTEGAQIGSDYDSLFAKIICYGENREDARQRMLLALDEVTIVGISHTAAFLRDVIASDYFERGELSTHFVDDYFSKWKPDDSQENASLIAAAMVASGKLGRGELSASSVLNGETTSRLKSPWSSLGGFQLWERR